MTKQEFRPRNAIKGIDPHQRHRERGILAFLPPEIAHSPSHVCEFGKLKRWKEEENPK
jgi:hypothetical protein